MEYRDVLLVCHNPAENLKLVAGLRQARIPLQVVTEFESDDADSDDEDESGATAVARKARDDAIVNLALAQENKMTVTAYKVVQGLERRVVIGTGKEHFGNKGIDQLYTMSRCTSQLIWLS